jgi:phospholipid-binding lipoprotein MlaA
MRQFLSVFILLGLLSLPAVAHAQPDLKKTPVVNVSPIADPLEPFNRAVFQFNRFVDFLILKPVSIVYKTVFPGFVRNSVSSFLGNLASPVVMANELLQGNFSGFENTLHRFVINTTLGVGGLNDVAASLGRPDRDNGDFGQTLGVWGVGHGFYLVLPIIGPSSLRDGTGRVVDAFADPYNNIMWNTDRDWAVWTRAGAVVLDKRTKYGDKYDDIMKTANDPYVTFRSIYAQRRAYLVQDKAVDAYTAAQ